MGWGVRGGDHINVREKHWLVPPSASLAHPNQGSNLPPRHVPCPGIESATFWYETTLQPTEPPGQGSRVFYTFIPSSGFLKEQPGG